MAFKRSAVRSRLSPPPSPENQWFSGLFLCQNGGFTPILAIFKTSLGTRIFAELAYQNNTRISSAPHCFFQQSKMHLKTSRWPLVSWVLAGVDNVQSCRYPHDQPYFVSSLRSLQGPAFGLHRCVDNSGVSTHEPLSRSPEPP